MKFLSSTSRDLDPKNYAWDSVVHQFNRPLLDSELNLAQDLLNKKLTTPSGVLSSQATRDAGKIVFETPFTGDSPNKVSNPSFLANTLNIERFKASVNGMLVDVKGTNSTDPSMNRVTLSEPLETGSLVDFVFLEVWRKEVTPSMGARARLRIASPLDNDTLSFADSVTTVTLTAGVDFQVSNSSPETARNLSDAINNHGGQGLGLTVGNVKVTSETRGTQYLFLSLTGGSQGNSPTFNITPNSTGVTVVGVPAGGSDGEGKPNANKVYYAGNLDSHSSLYLDDNIQDPTLNVSSSRRVQVQYRLRVHQIFNYAVSQNIFGFEHFNLRAQGSNQAPLNNFSFSKHIEDTGLWYSGSGSESDSENLGTVDGYIYAIPVAFVYRRNKPVSGTEGFQPLDRYNTGVLHDHDGSSLSGNIYIDNVPATDSDRPDGLFADEISEEDVLDLRRKVFPQGLDLSSELRRQYHSLLDGTNKTWIASAHNLADTGNGTAGISHTPLMCDVFGSSANTLNIGNHKRDFNHFSRRFSNAPVVERVFIVILPSAGGNPQGVSYTNSHPVQTGWHEGDVVEVDISQLDSKGDINWQPLDILHTPVNGINLPAGTKVTDIGLCWHNDGHYVNTIAQDVVFTSILGLGTDTITLTFAENSLISNGGTLAGADRPLVSKDFAVSGSVNTVLVELILETPSGDLGLTGLVSEIPDTHKGSYSTGSVIPLNDPENPQNLYPSVGNGVTSPIVNFRKGKKEVTLEYVYGLRTDNFVSSNSSFTRLPHRVYGDTSTIVMTDISNPASPTVLNLDSANSKFSHSEPILSWVGGWVSGQRAVEVQYHPVLPYHATDTSNSSVFVFYNRIAPQTCGSDFPLAQANISTSSGGVVPVELELQPLAIGDNITSLSRSDFSYPFEEPLEQLASAPLAESQGYNEYLVLNSNEVFLDDLTINTGSVDLPALVPISSNTNIQLGSTLTPPVKDNYNRALYRTVIEDTYFPASFAKNLSNISRHYKNVAPCLMKVTSDSHTLFRKGEVVLVLFIKTSSWGQSVSVDMRSDLNTNLVVACVYRTDNLILLGE
jgi:hypothetical protein